MEITQDKEKHHKFQYNKRRKQLDRQWLNKTGTEK